MKKALKKRYEHVPLLPQVLEQMMAIRLTPRADSECRKDPFVRVTSLVPALLRLDGLIKDCKT